MRNNLTKLVNRINSRKREAEKDKTRSAKWPRVRDRHLRSHPRCAACESTEHLQVHHIKPYHLHPELELAPDNLITLCMDNEDCHLFLGHGGSFRMFNPNVTEDVKKFTSGSAEERKSIRSDARKNRLK